MNGAAGAFTRSGSGFPGFPTGAGPGERGGVMDDDSESNWVVLGRHLRVIGLAIVGVVVLVVGFGVLA